MGIHTEVWLMKRQAFTGSYLSFARFGTCICLAGDKRLFVLARHPLWKPQMGFEAMCSFLIPQPQRKLGSPRRDPELLPLSLLNFRKPTSLSRVVNRPMVSPSLSGIYLSCSLQPWLFLYWFLSPSLVHPLGHGHTI